MTSVPPLLIPCPLSLTSSQKQLQEKLNCLCHRIPKHLERSIKNLRPYLISYFQNILLLEGAVLLVALNGSAELLSWHGFMEAIYIYI